MIVIQVYAINRNKIKEKQIKKWLILKTIKNDSY